MHFTSWTLRSRLIALTVLLVAATSLLIGAVMTVVIAQTLRQNFDNSLSTTLQGFQRGAPGGGIPRTATVDAGTVLAAYPSYGDPDGYFFTSDDQERANSSQLRSVRSAAGVTSSSSEGTTTFRTGTVDGVEYRFIVSGSGPDQAGTVVFGRSTSTLKAEIAAALVPIAVVVLLAILLAGMLGAWVVGRALRPLRRVAGVASNVASLPLERGDVELPERVPTGDTNPNTEVGQVGSALNNLLDSVETALAVRQASEEKVRHFVADASHELRTPLASIRGYAELTRRFGGELTEDVQHNIGRIESEAKRMTSLVEDLLLLARLDAERELETSDVDLSRLLVDAVSDANAAGRDHEWELDLPDEPVVVRGDQARLQQVFTNLLANARVHTPAGTRIVAQLAKPRDGHVLARVRDDGPGIPEELRPKLFGRFVRGDSSRARTTGSTGLGLSIVNAVVQAHHGTVSVASEPGTTVFTVQLPVEQPEPARAPQPA